MPAAKNTESCIVLIRSHEGQVDSLSYFGSAVSNACECARARTEDGDGEYSYAVKRVNGPRAAKISALAARNASDAAMLAVYLTA